jgi:hypothetical protein
VSTSAETAAEYMKRAEECERFATKCRAESNRTSPIRCRSLAGDGRRSRSRANVGSPRTILPEVNPRPERVPWMSRKWHRGGGRSSARVNRHYAGRARAIDGQRG